MRKTRKAERFFRADGPGLLTRWPTLVAFLLIAAFSGSGFPSATTMLQQCRQLFDSKAGDNTVQVANREQPRLVIATAASEKQNSPWHGKIDGTVPSVTTLAHPVDADQDLASTRQRQYSQFRAVAQARGPPRLS